MLPFSNFFHFEKISLAQISVQQTSLNRSGVRSSGNNVIWLSPLVCLVFVRCWCSRILFICKAIIFRAFFYFDRCLPIGGSIFSYYFQMFSSFPIQIMQQESGRFVLVWAPWCCLMWASVLHLQPSACLFWNFSIRGKLQGPFDILSFNVLNLLLIE